MFLSALAPLGPEAVGQFMNVGDYITRVGTALGIDMDGLIKSEQQMQQERQMQMQQMQQQQMADMAKAGVGPMAKEVAGAAREAVARNGE
jgi:hypothetical protein